MQLIGRLAAEPELTATATGKELVRYALGVSTGPKSGETGERATSWFRVVSFQEGPQRDLLVGLPKGEKGEGREKSEVFGSGSEA
ncbi:ssDNA-binding protein, mitochondrial [Elasticomyces elasticus]|nr:ssDNA-binding protein, mitochondrial [Elasticomyces elasticus]